MTESSYTRQRTNTIKACTVTSTNPGNGHLIRWTTAPIPGVAPGSDANDMNQAFSGVDIYGMPTIAPGVAAPTYDGNVAGINIPNTAGFQVAICDGWIVVPAGVVSITTVNGALATPAGHIASINKTVS